MSLLQQLGIDIANVNASKAEKQIESGGRVPVGKHHAALIGARAGETGNGSKYRELTFRILAGPGEGLELKDKVFMPHAGQKEEARKTMENRVLIFMHRLGLLTKDGDNYRPVEGRQDFTDVVDKVDCVIDVKHEERTYEVEGKQKNGTFAILTFEGVLPLNDKRCGQVPCGKFTPGETAPVTATLPAQADRKRKYANV